MSDRSPVKFRPPQRRLATRRPFLRRVAGPAAILILVTGLAGLAAGCAVLWQQGRTPREWAAWLQRAEPGDDPLLRPATDAVAAWLTEADRLAVGNAVLLPASLGASVSRSGDIPPGRLRLVSSLQDLADAAGDAEPGDVIQINPGHYLFQGLPIHLSRPGTRAAPITVRAARLGEVVIESDGIETFKVTAPFWRIENLSMRGICADHSGCEHAFHVVAGGTDTVIRNNVLADYNAHIKINGEAGAWPDHGVVDGNTLTDTKPRMTANPVAPVDLVAASNWLITGNIITDFVRGVNEGEPTYGGFVKGEGEGNVIERNLVVCEWKLRNVHGEHVGLSLVAGSTDVPVRREKGYTGFEQLGGVIRDNLVALCSDDGIYLNRSARSVVDHNTLLDTAGIDVRFVETSATVTGNIVDGVTRSRNGAALSGRDNDGAYLLGLFLGLHPQRGYFRDPATLDLAWRDPPESLPNTEARPDLCGQLRGHESPPGAFANYSACLGGQ